MYASLGLNELRHLDLEVTQLGSWTSLVVLLRQNTPVSIRFGIRCDLLKIIPTSYLCLAARWALLIDIKAAQMRVIWFITMNSTIKDRLKPKWQWRNHLRIVDKSVNDNSLLYISFRYPMPVEFCRMSGKFDKYPTTLDIYLVLDAYILLILMQWCILGPIGLLKYS